MKYMQRGIKWAVILLCVGSLSARAADVPDQAVNSPDEFSWKLFTQVVAPAASTGNDNALFETWASDADTFKIPPQFPTGGPSPMSLHPPVLASLMAQRMGLKPHVLPGGSEEVRRNKVAFQFIVDNNLYTQDGLVKAFVGGKPVVFPTDSIEVKANWIPANSPGIDPSKYHVNTASDGKRYVLVAMHIISKQIPNWTWATFEHEDNAGRCDYIGCRDSFGAIEPNVSPMGSNGQKYPACDKTPALQAMFKAANIGDVWKNYCLKGSQIDFTDSTGVPTHLGNSVPEAGFVNTASCMTCHARAAVDGSGNATSQAGFLVPPDASKCPTGNPCSPNGVPDPDWFWSNPGAPSPKMVALQMDFVWAIPYCAIPHGQTRRACP